MAVVLAGCLLPACGGSRRGELPTEGGVPPAVWAGSLCDALDRWIDAVDERSDRLGAQLAEVTSLLAARNELIAFMDDLMASTDRLLVMVEGAGHPDVPEGRALARGLRRAFAEARTVFREGRRRATYVSIDDQQRFQAEATALSASIQAASRDVDEAIERTSRRYPSEDLDAAFSSEPACQGLNVRS